MHYKSIIYQLNSLRLGLVHEDNIYGQPTIFLVMGSQSADIESHLKRCNHLLDQKGINLIAVPFNNNGSEPGDNYEIVAHYENVLNIKFYVTEKIDTSHKFFEDFGVPTCDFTEYHFDAKTKFIKKV